MRGHIRFIHEGVGYNCDKCDLQFGQKASLLRHKEVVHNQKTDDSPNEGIIYGCNQCNYKSTILEELISHKNNLHEKNKADFVVNFVISFTLSCYLFDHFEFKKIYLWFTGVKGNIEITKNLFI